MEKLKIRNVYAFCDFQEYLYILHVSPFPVDHCKQIVDSQIYNSYTNYQYIQSRFTTVYNSSIAYIYIFVQGLVDHVNYFS